MDLYIDSFDKEIMLKNQCFEIIYKSQIYIISSHRYLPVKKVKLNKDKLNISINSKWNELLISKSNGNNKLKRFLDYRIQLLPIQTQVFISERNNHCEIVNYNFINMGLMPNYPKILYIILKSQDTKNISIGSPVYYENNVLIGMVSYIKDDIIYCLPYYYILKTFENINDVLVPNEIIKETDILKINNYNVKDNKVYHPSIKMNIPISCYFLLETNKKINITKHDSLESIPITFSSYNNSKLIPNNKSLYNNNGQYDISIASLHILKIINPTLCKRLFDKLKYTTHKDLKLKMSNSNITVIYN